jgi:UDP-N-acetylmuramate dehydrogenase
MFQIKENISLASYTTFKIGGSARFFCSVTSEDDLVKAIAYAREKQVSVFVLGGGSNILINDNGFDGLVIKIDIGGIEKVKSEIRQLADKVKSGESTTISVGAGVQWDTFVEYVVEHGLYGVENLSAIPGTVGAAPVQNIGAYGAEASQVIHSVRAFDTQIGEFIEISNADCHFSYRDSVFKKEKGRYIITRVDFELTNDGSVNIEYKDVKEYFEKVKASFSVPLPPSIREVRSAIIDIRMKKLPDWKRWGTAGSFFKNPIISAEHFQGLKDKYPDLPGFPESNGTVKVSLGWILDKLCNARGLCKGNACVYDKQALVLVTKPGATAEEVVALAQELMKVVKDKTDIEIEGEVEWVN